MNGPHEPEFPFSACLLFACLVLSGGMMLLLFVLMFISWFHR